MPSYNCFRCGFTSRKKTNFVRHLTRKHKCAASKSSVSILEVARANSITLNFTENSLKFTADSLKFTENGRFSLKNQGKFSNFDNLVDKNLSNSSNNLSKKKYQCPNCNKFFTRKDNLKVHQKKSCSNVNNIIANENESLKMKIVELEQKQQQHDIEKYKLYNHIENLVSSVTKNNQISNIENQNNTNNNTNYIQQNIHINSFGKEDIKYLRSQFLDKLIKAPFGAIPKLIKAIHFNPAHPENRNVKITNKKDRFADIYKNNKWILADKKTVIGNMIDKGFDIIDEHHNDNNDKLNGFKKKNFMRFKNQYEDNNKNLMKNIEKNIEVQILNNSR